MQARGESDSFERPPGTGRSMPLSLPINHPVNQPLLLLPLLFGLVPRSPSLRFTAASFPGCLSLRTSRVRRTAAARRPPRTRSMPTALHRARGRDILAMSPAGLDHLPARSRASRLRTRNPGTRDGNIRFAPASPAETDPSGLGGADSFPGQRRAGRQARDESAPAPLHLGRR